MAKIMNVFVLLLGMYFFNAQASAGETRSRNAVVASSHAIQVTAGWNLMSIPAIVTDSLKTSLFPTSTSTAYVYDNSYIAKDTLGDGFGFWLKFSSPQTIFVEGDSIFAEGIPVKKGWNMIGSLSVPMPVKLVYSQPDSIISSKYYRFAAGTGYVETDTIQPGGGYWIKVKQDGMLYLTAPGNETVTFSDSVRTLVLDSVDVHINNLPGVDRNDDYMTLLTYLRTRPEFEASDTTRGGVWARFTDGRIFIYTDNLIPPDSTIDSVAMPKNPLRKRLPAEPNDAIPNNSGAWIVNSLGPLFSPSSGYSADGTVNNLRQWHQSVGYTPVARAGATVPDLMIVPNVGVFYMSAHGANAYDRDSNVVYSIFTATEQTEFLDEVYKRDLDDGTLVYFSAPHRRNFLGFRQSETHYAFTAKFVRRYISFNKPSIVFINACSSFNTELGEAFIAKGADLYLGWTLPVVGSDAFRVASRFFDRALGTNKEHPENPPQRPFDLQLCVEDIILKGYNVSNGPDGPSVFSFYPLFPYTNLLAPSILQCYQLPIPGFEDFEIDGLFGDPSPGAATIKVGGDVLGIQEWVNSTKFRLDPPTHGGNVQVTVRGRKSNVTQYTEWHAVFDYTLTSRGSLKQHIVMNVNFLADVHHFRLHIGDPPVYPFPRYVQVLNTSSATFECSGEYRDPEDTAFVVEWWDGSGTVPLGTGSPGLSFGTTLAAPGNSNLAQLGFQGEFTNTGYAQSLGIAFDLGNLMLTMNSSYVILGGSKSDSYNYDSATLSWGDVTPMYPPDPNGAR